MGSSYIPSSHEGTGKRAQEIIEVERATDTRSAVKQQGDLDALTKEQERHVPRSGGALEEDAFKGAEIELANELLLVALGLGQHRAEDGCTMLFEQDNIFGDVDDNATASTSAEELRHASDDIKEQEPKTATSRASDFGSRAWETASLSFNKATRDIKGLAKGSDANQEARDKDKAPLKPNEPCHYDSRARAIIFVAITAMGVQASNIFMAEKVIAQMIYFILSEGRTEATKQGKGDPLQEAHAEKSGRQSWMNSASSGAVTKAKSEGKWGRYLATGAGVTLGGVVIGLTGVLIGFVRTLH